MAMRKDRRQSTRTRKRLKVEYGIAAPEHAGFTTDISAGGIYLVANRLAKAGTRLHLKVYGPKQHLFFEGQVVRARRVPETLRRIEQQGMGVRFLRPEELVPLLVPPQAERQSMGVECNRPDDLVRLLNEQLRQNVCAVWFPQAQPPAVGAVVTFEVRLGFLPGKQDVQASGRVAQILSMGLDPAGNPRQSAVIMVDDCPALCEKLEAALRAASG